MEQVNCSVSNISEVLTDKDLRLEAGTFDKEAESAAVNVERGNYSAVKFSEVAKSYTLGRSVRVIAGKSPYPFYQPSSVTDVKPKIDGYLWAKQYSDIEELIIHKGQVLLTCSGSIGRAVYVSDGLDNKILSHDMLRIDCKNPEDAGYIYAYLKSSAGQKILQSMIYGAVIPHIEAEHLQSIPVPNAPAELRRKIHELVVKSYALRDESNVLLDEAESLLASELRLPPINEMKQEDGALIFSINGIDFVNSGRFEASYHSPLFGEIVRHLQAEAEEVTTVGDKRVSKKIILPGRFKRVYVEEGYGVPFFGGRSIFELDPSDKKYLSLSQHEKLIHDELVIRENMILVTCSGTLGNVMLVPKHWDNWAVTHDIIRVIPQSGLEGYAWIWLQSDYVKAIIDGLSYGAVVKHVEIEHVASVPFPFLKNKDAQDKINSLALQANSRRYEAYKLEREAMNIMEHEIISA
ncbi:MAG: restriction endonuclease subunit S [Synergistaceae bacterium]|nr:restriction endonuclease subunit S [Synergistaceae bacterium]